MHGVIFKIKTHAKLSNKHLLFHKCLINNKIDKQSFCCFTLSTKIFHQYENKKAIFLNLQ
jgi:hypothetical protein